MSRTPERPWQEVILERYRARKPGSLGPLQVKVAVDYLTILNQACRVAGVERNTFIRRAVAVHAAAVLGVNPRSLLQHCPPPRQWGQSAKRAGLDEVDTGEGLEKWCPHPGCDGAHLNGPGVR